MCVCVDVCVWVCFCMLARAVMHRLAFPFGWLIGWLVDWVIEWVIDCSPCCAIFKLLYHCKGCTKLRLGSCQNEDDYVGVVKNPQMQNYMSHTCHEKEGDVGGALLVHESFGLMPRSRLARLLETIGEGADLDFAREAGCQVAQICVRCIPLRFLPLCQAFLKGVDSQQLGSPSSSCSDSWWWGLVPRWSRWRVLWNSMIRGMILDELGQTCILLLPSLKFRRLIVFQRLIHNILFFMLFMIYVLWVSWKILSYLSSLRKEARICRGWSTTLQRIQTYQKMQTPTAYNLHPRVCDVQTL